MFDLWICQRCCLLVPDISAMDCVQDVCAWANKKDATLPFPIVADPALVLSKQLGMIDPDEKDQKGMPLTCRAVSFTNSCPFTSCKL